MKDKAWLWFLARLFIGGIFAYAGFTKLIDPIENFRGNIAQYEVIPYFFVPAIAWVLPWLEFVGGVMMILGYAPKTSSLLLGSLCLGFVLILGSSEAFLSMGRHDCGCFGEGSLIRFSMHQVFVIDVINFFLCFRLFQREDHFLSLDTLLRRKENRG